MQAILRVWVVVYMSQMLERRQINTKVLLLECNKSCDGSSVEECVVLNVKSQTIR